MARRHKGNKQAKAKRCRLWHMNPHCYWCGEPTVLQRVHACEHGQRIATVDHLYSRFHPARQDGPGAQTVLACLTCNAERAHQENLIFRDFVRTLAQSGVVGFSNRQKVRAFALALALCLDECEPRFDKRCDGITLAQVFVSAWASMPILPQDPRQVPGKSAPSNPLLVA